MKKQIEVYRKLHGQTGKHVCQRPGCTTMVMGAYCMKHLEAAIAKQWDEIIETGEPSPQLPEEIEK